MWEFSTTHESSKLACAGEFDACVDNPCQNSGACTDVVGGAYDASGRTCTCGDGFTGDSCETDVHACTANPCQNSGACTDVVGGASDASGRTCTCGNGFTGDSCETGASCSLVPGDANGSEYHVSSDYTAEQCLAKCVIDGANAMTVGSNVSFGNGSTGSCYCEVGATRLGSSSSSWKNCFIAGMDPQQSCEDQLQIVQPCLRSSMEGCKTCTRWTYINECRDASEDQCSQYHYNSTTGQCKNA